MRCAGELHLVRTRLTAGVHLSVRQAPRTPDCNLLPPRTDPLQVSSTKRLAVGQWVRLFMSDTFVGNRTEDCSLVAPNKTTSNAPRAARRIMLQAPQQQQLSPAELAMLAQAQSAAVNGAGETDAVHGSDDVRVPVEAVDGDVRVPVDSVTSGAAPPPPPASGGAPVGSLAWWIYGSGLAFSGAADSRAFAAPYGPGTRYLMK